MNEGLRIYNLFPTLAGTIRDWMVHLPRIARLGFNAVYINPFHYPGFSGSIYAVKDYYRLNPRFRGQEPGEDDDALLRRLTDTARASAARDHGPSGKSYLQGQRAYSAPSGLVHSRC
jgi:starch synthase (maltosyl-transferring)